MISTTPLTKQVHTNICPILNGYGVMTTSNLEQNTKMYKVVVNLLKCNYYWNVYERDLFSLFSFMLFVADMVHITGNVWHHPNCWHTEYYFIICLYLAVLPVNTLCWRWRLLNSVISFLVCIYTFVCSKVVICKDSLQKVKNSDC